MAKILICDDDADIVAALKIYLASPDYELFTASTGREALESIRENDIDLVLMGHHDAGDGRPRGHGQAARGVQHPRHTADGQERALRQGAGASTWGADDYVTKPFDPVEVQARVRSHLRRYMRLGGRMEPEPKKDVITIGGVELDDAAKSVTVDGEPVSLTPIEYNILHLLMRNPNRVFSSSQIYELVWNENAIGSEGSVAVHIRHLPGKNRNQPQRPALYQGRLGPGLQDGGSEVMEKKEKFKLTEQLWAKILAFVLLGVFAALLAAGDRRGRIFDGCDELLGKRAGVHKRHTH